MTSTPLKTSDISIIIPTLNEEENIRALPDFLGETTGEILIVDGGSSDQTITVAREKGYRVETYQTGRAIQLNHGANCSTGKVFLFLHADTLPPVNFAQLLLEALEKKNVIAGAFSLSIKNSSLSLRFIAGCANLRSRYRQLPYGDQGIFITREQFFQLGQFPSLPIMEDYAFMKKVQQAGKVCTLPQPVTTSARRWQRLGVFRTTLTNLLIILGYNLKIPMERLASLYRR